MGVNKPKPILSVVTADVVVMYSFFKKDDVSSLLPVQIRYIIFLAKVRLRLIFDTLFFLLGMYL